MICVCSWLRNYGESSSTCSSTSWRWNAWGGSEGRPSAYQNSPHGLERANWNRKWRGSNRWEELDTTLHFLSLFQLFNGLFLLDKQSSVQYVGVHCRSRIYPECSVIDCVCVRERIKSLICCSELLWSHLTGHTLICCLSVSVSLSLSLSRQPERDRVKEHDRDWPTDKCWNWVWII